MLYSLCMFYRVEQWNEEWYLLLLHSANFASWPPKFSFYEERWMTFNLRHLHYYCPKHFAGLGKYSNVGMGVLLPGYLELNCRAWWPGLVARLTTQPAQALLEGGAELFELDGVDEGVDGRVGVAQPEHEPGPVLGERNLNMKNTNSNNYN